MKEYKIASIAGDGIGKEVVPEAQKILKEVANQHYELMNLIFHRVIIMKNTETCCLMIGRIK